MKLSEQIKHCMDGNGCDNCENYESRSRLTCPRLMQKAYEKIKKHEETELSKAQEKIISMVLEERKRQDEKWGKKDHSAYVWTGIIGEEYGEMCQAINEFCFNPTPETEQDIYTEAIQTIASCMAMLERIEINRQ